MSTDETHPALQELLKPIRELHGDVRRKSLMRLEYDGSKIEGSEAEKAAVAMKKYAYYICFKCKGIQSRVTGHAHIDHAPMFSVTPNPTLLVVYPLVFSSLCFDIVCRILR